MCLERQRKTCFLYLYASMQSLSHYSRPSGPPRCSYIHTNAPTVIRQVTVTLKGGAVATAATIKTTLLTSNPTGEIDVDSGDQL